MLDRLRARLNGYLLGLGRAFTAFGLSPTAWTAVGFLVAVLSGASFSLSGYKGELLGGLLILGSGFFDIVDGAVARVTNAVSKRGGFLDSTLDRLAEVAIFTGILVGNYTGSTVVLLSLSFSLLVSYTRAKGDSLGISLSGVGVGERSERLIVLAVFSLLGLVDLGVFIVLLMAGYTFLERTYRASRSLSQAVPSILQPP
ncbi:MAG: CDP-alcohol phosphatidyltransferase family protein [Nitrososphaerales archaeon]|nr:CDP-alcohol phosphatidyltransferase family protein [Nitrososphaerales archaeon]